ncbi:peroxiredoxin [bacterium DOLZORAL124_38_8]|nr:MAG: peroxiredoxin [bacterium DOLZORAL124_38_8]
MNEFKFTLLGSDGKTYTQNDFKTGKVVIYAYPKDATPGCTIQANQFEELKPEFEKLGVRVFGISADSDESHQKFCNKQGLSFVLLSDPEKQLLEPIGAWREKVNFGKRYMGIARSTYLFKDGELVKQWKAARAKDNAERVLTWWQEN